MTAVRDF